MNKRILKLAFMDVKMMVQSIKFAGGIAAAVLFLSLWIIRRPEAFDTDTYMSMFFEVMKYVLLINSIMALGTHYKNGTYKYLFSGMLTRKQIMYEKLLAVILLALVCGLIQTVTRTAVSVILNEGFKMNDLFSVNILCEIWLYVIFALLTGSYGLMLLSITGRVKTAFVSGIAIFGIIQYYSAAYMTLLSGMETLTVWQKAIFFTPNYIIWSWMQQEIPSLIQNTTMTGYILMMFIIGRIAISKRDLNVEQ